MDEKTSVLFLTEVLDDTLTPHGGLVENLGSIEDEFSEQYSDTQRNVVLNELIINWFHPSWSASVIKLLIHVINHP